MIEFEIDGKKIQAEEGSTIIEAADEHGVYIPRFCYHKNLSIAANCRMCLVEVEKVGKPLPACATPATSDMKVSTKSKMAVEAQRAVMQFLLINHPLDCPVCDQGGECDLQDTSMGYGDAKSFYTQGKRAVDSDDIGPLIETEMTRCIHCTRCVRFGEEVAGLRELGATFRGEHMQIGTYVKHFMKSEMSGNVIDLCPVGALTNKPARYEFRSWEMQEHSTIAPHDCVGTNMYVHTRGRQYSKQRVVMRSVPRENDAINETWMSDRDRYGVHSLYHEERLLRPRMKHEGKWVEVEWEKALVEISASMKVIKEHHGGEQFAAIASPSATTEEYYLLQKLMRGLGSNNVDHRVSCRDFRDQHLVPEFPNLGMAIADIEELEAILLVGSNVRFDQPLLSHRINKAAQQDAAVMAINPIDYPFTFQLQQKLVQADLLNGVAQVAKALAEQTGEQAPALVDVTVTDEARAMAEKLKHAERAAVFLGGYALEHAQASQLRALVRLIGRLSGANIGVFTHGANSSGAWLAGAVPHRGPAGAKIEAPGLDAKALLTDKYAHVYILLNLEPEFDTAYAEEALKALKHSGLVICLTPYVTPMMQDYADVLLPITPFTETDGTFVNIEGAWQSFEAVSVPLEDAKPGWKVLRVLANFLDMSDFNYKSASDVRDELKGQVDAMDKFNGIEQPPETVKPANDALLRVASTPIYRVNNLVRRVDPLQEVFNSDFAMIRMNQATAEKQNLKAFDVVKAKQGDSEVTMPLAVDNTVADNLVVIPAGLEQTAGFGCATDAVELTVVREAS